MASGGKKNHNRHKGIRLLSYHPALEMTALYLFLPAAFTAFRRQGVKMEKCDAAVSKAHKKNENQCKVKMEEVIRKSSTENLFLKRLCDDLLTGIAGFHLKWKNVL